MGCQVTTVISSKTYLKAGNHIKNMHLLAVELKTQKLRVRFPLRGAVAHPADSQHYLRDSVRKTILRISALGRHVGAHLGSPELHLSANSQEGQLPNPRRQAGSGEGRSRTYECAQSYQTPHLTQVSNLHPSIDGVQRPIGGACLPRAGAGCASPVTHIIVVLSVKL